MLLDFHCCALVNSQVSVYRTIGPTLVLTVKAPNTTIAELANTVDPDETAHNEPSHLDLQCLPSSL